MYKALILVDIQNDFLPGGTMAVPKGNDVIPVANRLAPIFDIVVVTQEWHPREHGSFAANHSGKKAGQTIKLGGVNQVLWPVHSVQDTPGADFPKNLDRRRVEQTFRKGTDPEIEAYSGFFDNGKKKSTGMDEYLKKKEVSQVYVMGLATEIGVRATAIDAVSLGYETFIIEDGCRGMNAEEAVKALDEMREAGISVLGSRAILETVKIRRGA